MFGLLKQKSDPAPVEDAPPPPSKFTLTLLKSMHQQLQENRVVTPANEAAVREVLRGIAEMVVYGDSKSELLFDFFCEANMLGLFLDIMRAPSGCPMPIHVQILQTLSILCQSIRNSTSIYYLLSNNFMNDIISYPYDFNDEEIRDTFISLMKSLSLRLNTNTVQFFFIEETGAYPLLSRAISFLKFSEPMVRTAAQAIILNVYRIDESQARKYALQDNILDRFLDEVVKILNDYYTAMLECCMAYKIATQNERSIIAALERRSAMGGKTDAPASAAVQFERQLESTITSFEDWLYYLQDVIDLKVPKLTRMLIVRLISGFVYPTLLGPIELQFRYFSNGDLNPVERLSNGSTVDVSHVNSMGSPSLCSSLSLFVICQMIRVVTSPELHRALVVSMLHPINNNARAARIRSALQEASTNAGEPSLSEQLLGLGLSANDKKVIRPGKSNNSSGNLSGLTDASSEVAATPEEMSLPLDSNSLINGAGAVDQVESNFTRYGFESLFMELENGRNTDVAQGKSGSRVDPLEAAKGDQLAVEDIRSSMLAVLILGKLCASVVSLVERSRYAETPGEGGDDGADEDAASSGPKLQFTSAATFIYSHLFEDLRLWPSLASDGSLFPPSEMYWKSASTEADASAAVTPCSCDVSMEVAYANSYYPNPFSEETRNITKPQRRDSLGGVVVDPTMAGSKRRGVLTPAQLEVGALSSLLGGMQWIDCDIVPVPLLDALYNQDKGDGKWRTDVAPTTIPVLLSNLLATSRAQRSLATMQLCVGCMCQYSYLIKYAVQSQQHPSRESIHLDGIRTLIHACSEQLEIKAKQLIGHANGAMADDFLGMFENEVLRAQALATRSRGVNAFSALVERLGKEAPLLLLQNSTLDYSNYSEVISDLESMKDRGSETLQYIQSLEEMRRDIEIFLLLRSAVKRLRSFVNDNTPVQFNDSNDVKKSADEIFTKIVDEQLSILGPTVSKGLDAGATVVMKGRQCVAAFIISSVRSRFSSPIATPKEAAAAATIAAFVAVPNGSPSPSSPANAGVNMGSQQRTPDRSRKTGDVYFVLDDASILVAAPDKSRLDKGIVRIVFPIYNAVAILESDSHDLRILVQSTTPITGLTEVSCNAFPVARFITTFSVGGRGTADAVSLSPSVAATDSALSPLVPSNAVLRRSSVANKQFSFDSFQPPIVETSTYEIILGFENSKSCKMVAKHIATCRARARAQKLDNIRSFLTFWSDSNVSTQQEV